jgi:hypothetical protein
MTEVIAPPAESPVTKTRAGPMVRHHRRDHLPDRAASMSPFYIPALKPVEAAIGIVRSLLLGKKQSDPKRSASVDHPALRS